VGMLGSRVFQLSHFENILLQASDKKHL